MVCLGFGASGDEGGKAHMGGPKYLGQISQSDGNCFNGKRRVNSALRMIDKITFGLQDLNPNKHLDNYIQIYFNHP